jgi:hypothetical protein
VGIDFGEYWVTAVTASGLSSQTTVRVEVTPEVPVAEAEVVVGRHEGVLRVVDDAGTVVRDVSVEAGDVMLTEVGPGVLSLDGVPVGARLMFRASGHVPVCRFLQPADLPELRVALARATETLTLSFPSDLAWETGTFLDMPGSECPIGVGDLETAVDATPTTTRVALKVSPGRFRYVLDSASYALAAPGGEVRLGSPGQRR